MQNVWVGNVRTNIEIDDDHLRTVMDRYGLRSKTEAVDLALRHLAGQPMTREEAPRDAGRARDRPVASRHPTGTGPVILAETSA